MKTRFFPFAPGIPWKMKNGKYVVPEISGSLLDSHLKDRDLVVVCFGGLVEAFFSMSILETYNYHNPGKRLYWAGNKDFLEMLKSNGLFRGLFSEIDESVVDRFPTPLFFDKENRAYFNCLVNYMTVKSYYGKIGYEDKRPIFQQITEKALLPWEERFLPQIRGSNIMPSELERRLSVSKVDLSRPYALIFPNRNGISIHKESGLSWNMAQIRAFCALLNQKDIKPIIVSNDRGFYTKDALILPFKIEFLFHLLPRAAAALSKDVDLLLIANVVSNAKIISDSIEGCLSTVENNHIIGRKNVIYTRKELTPTKAVNLVTRKL